MVTEQRVMYVFSPAEDDSWGLTFDRFAAALHRRTPDSFTRLRKPPAADPAPNRHPRLAFGFTVGGQVLDGIAKERPEGAALLDADAHDAADFALWLREHIAPTGAAITFTTESGLASDLVSTLPPGDSRAAMIAAFVDHIRAADHLTDE